MTTPINWQPAHLENELVQLVPLTADDFERLYAVAADPLIWEQHPSKDRYKREGFQLFFEGGVISNTAFLMIEKATGTVMGSTRYYDYKPEGPSIAIGYTFLARAYWGGSYNRSIKKLMLDYAFQFVDKVYFHIGQQNLRSQYGTMKLGAKKVRDMDFESNGQLLPYCEYVIHKYNLESETMPYARK